jgi:hypothetical protein
MVKHSDECYTPAWVFDALGVQFDLDVCGPKTGACVPALKTYTIEDDGLSMPWGGCVWMNPPFSKPRPWVKKFMAHGNGIALLPFAKSQWFNDLLETDPLLAVLDPKIRFTKDGRQHSIFMAVGLFGIGSAARDAFARFREYTKASKVCHP